MLGLFIFSSTSKISYDSEIYSHSFLHVSIPPDRLLLVHFYSFTEDRFFFFHEGLSGGWGGGGRMSAVG